MFSFAPSAFTSVSTLGMFTPFWCTLRPHCWDGLFTNDNHPRYTSCFDLCVYCFDVYAHCDTHTFIYLNVKIQLLAMDILVLATMKNAAKCDT